MGNFIPVAVSPATISNGQTPITIDWDYLQSAYTNEFKDKLDWGIQIPEEAVFGNFYCQAINAATSRSTTPWRAPRARCASGDARGVIVTVKGAPKRSRACGLCARKHHETAQGDEEVAQGKKTGRRAQTDSYNASGMRTPWTAENLGSDGPLCVASGGPSRVARCPSRGT